METPAPLPVVLCLTALIDGLFEAVCARYGVFPIRGPLVRFLWKRLFWVKRRFANIAARFASGTDLSPRPSRPARAPAPRGPADAHGFRLRRWVNPKFGWLRRIASESIGAGAYAYALRELLSSDPEMLTLLAATPATARILRPLCWMLGVAVPRFSGAAPVSSAEPFPEKVACRDEASRDVPIAAIPWASPTPAPPDPPEIFLPPTVLKAA